MIEDVICIKWITTYIKSELTDDSHQVPAIGTCQGDDTAGTSELGIVHKLKKTTSCSIRD